jgi:hypothetical protein
MFKTLLLLIAALIFACSSPKKSQQTYSLNKGFDFISVKDTFKLTITEFHKNDAYPYTEGLPYALLIGKTNKVDFPKQVSVLAIRDNNSYNSGDVVTIHPIEDLTKTSTLKPIYFVKDTVVGRLKCHAIIGTEYPAIWATVSK